MGEKMNLEQAEAMLRLLALERFDLYMTTLTEDEYWDSSGKGRLALCINCNDYFYPASDSEEITPEEAPKLLSTLLLVKKEDRDFVMMQWVADKRGIPHKRFRDKEKNNE